MPITIWSVSLNSAPRDSAAPGSGAQDLIGYDIDLSAEDGSTRVTLTVIEQHLNRNRSLHGGIVAMILDAAAGFAVSRYLAPDGDALLVTVTLNIQYLAPGLENATVTAVGRRVGGGRKIHYADAELRDESGTVLARASGVFKPVGRPQ